MLEYMFPQMTKIETQSCDIFNSFWIIIVKNTIISWWFDKFKDTVSKNIETFSSFSYFDQDYSTL